jgi:hypothetical protein
MQSKTFVLLLLLISLIVLGLSARSLNRLTNESVVQATNRYATSGHADREARAFTLWSNNDPPVVPAFCARCHGTPGFLDYLGADGSPPGAMNRRAPAGEVVTCIACHNPTAHALEQVAFQSGVEFKPVQTEATCLICHQSLESTNGLRDALEGLEDDVVSPYSFIDPHYKIAASTQLGSVAHSGYEYPEREYAGYFAHAAGAETCTDCHNPHDLTVEPKKCAPCHLNVVRNVNFLSIRTQKTDYDGDLDTTEGIYSEIRSLQALLLKAIQEYARRVAGKPIVYADQSPYFCIDANDNGIADAEEINTDNSYDAWTPRLLRAAYNYQFVVKDAGGYVHNPRYVIQLLHDSLIALEKQVPLPDVKLLRPRA